MEIPLKVYFVNKFIPCFSTKKVEICTYYDDLSDPMHTIRRHKSDPGYLITLGFHTAVTNPLTLYCDHFDQGADHSLA